MAESERPASCETCSEPTVGRRVIHALRLPQKDVRREFHAGKCWDDRLGEWEQVKSREVRS